MSSSISPPPAAHAATHTPTVSASDRRRAFVGASIGNAIEWYDFAAYGAVAAYVGSNFFPSGDSSVELLSSLAVFGLSFLARPLGGLFFGPLADRLGRKRVMVIVLIMMSTSTAAIGLLPTHAAIGIAAPILLIALRCIQGFSAGGEFGSVSSFLMEYAGKGRRGFSTSWMMFSTISGFLLGSAIAAALAYSLDDASMSSWGWRVPFLVAAPLGAVALYIRLRLEESPAFLELSRSGHVAKTPLREVFSVRWGLLSTVCIAGLHATAFYVIFTFMVSYISKTLNQGSGFALASTLVSGAVALAILPAAGRFSDVVGRRPVLLVGAVGFLVLTYPLFALMSTGRPVAIMAGQAILAALLAVYISTSVVSMAEMFPPRVRSAGISIGYNLPAAVLGGMAPFAATYLVTQTDDTRSPAFYLAAVAVIACAGLIFAFTKGHVAGEDTDTRENRDA